MNRTAPVPMPFLSLLWAVLVSLACVQTTSAQNTDLMVIANAKGSPTSLSMKEVKAIFHGEKQRWSDGTRIEIVLMDFGSETGRITAERLYGKTPDQLKYFWAITVFSGKSEGPRVFDDLDALQRHIASHPGSIAVISRSNDPSIKPVTVDGKVFF